jgi:NAD(P)-dependent dehydrogenase (short-subunit alcohol dehydrogenase family)
MPDRAALVTGASSGIGLAIARVLGDEGFALTVAARRPEKLSAAAGELRAAGHEVEEVAADMADEDAVRGVVARHRERFGRLDVLVNNAGVGIGAPVAETTTKRLDLQLDINLRAMILFYRECADLLRAAAADRGSAQVINMASVTGKSGQPWLSVYSATKGGVVAFTESMNRELGGAGVKSVALCPGYVDTAMTDFIKEEVSPDDMIKTSDIAEAVRFLLRTSRACVVPEIIFHRLTNEL